MNFSFSSSGERNETHGSSVPAAMTETDQEFFEVGAVARLTGISPHVLRVWERRYGVVDPKRSDTKRRQYSQSDIQRLSLLKTLVDNGHAIGSIANLSTIQLEERLSNALESRSDRGSLEEPMPEAVCRIAVAGAVIRKPVREAADTSPGLRIVGEFPSMEEVEKSLRPGALDLLVVQQDTAFPEDIEKIQQVVTRMKARRAILVYRFASEEAIEPLDVCRITALRAPVDAAEIRLACISDIRLATRSIREEGDGKGESASREVIRVPAGEIPERVFSDEQLLRVAQTSPAVKCECPRHLANLLSGLFAFEQYSQQCEDRNEEDAKLHAFLHHATAQCRSQMEAALSEVLEQEGIEV